MPHSIHSINTPLLTLHSLRTCRLCAKLFNDFVGITVPCPRDEGVDTRAATPAELLSTPPTCPRKREKTYDPVSTLPQSPDANVEQLWSIDCSGNGDADKVVAVDIVGPTLSPIPENFFDDAAWEDLAPPPRPRLTPLPPLSSRLTAAPVLLEVVSDFSFQSRVLDQISQLLGSGSSQQRSLLCVQPTSSGKGAYALAMSKHPSRCCRISSLKLCRL